MDKAAYSLIGVALGAALTFIRDWWSQRKQNKKDANYLAIQISCMLDRFVSGCAEVAQDDGLYHGQPDSEGYSHIQVTTPKFEPDKAKVEWKSLPAELMYEVLTFPDKIEIAENYITATFEYSATPPDYAEGFEERQLRYSELGIEAAALADKLRTHSKLPNKSFSGWDPVQQMRDARGRILSHRAKIQTRPAPSL